MKGRKDLRFYLKKVAHGVIASVLILIIFFIINNGEKIDELLLYEVIPDYGVDKGIKNVSEAMYEKDEQDETDDTESQSTPEGMVKYETEYIEIIETMPEQENMGNQPNDQAGQFANMPGDIDKAASLTDNTNAEATAPGFKVTEVEETQVESGVGIIGLDDVIYQPESFTVDLEGHFSESLAIDIEKLKDMNYLLNNFYLVDPKTGIPEGMIDPVTFLDADMKLKSDIDGPQILIFHTHSQEMFKDSNSLMEGIMGAGELLCKILESKYGINTMHDMSTYDLIDGKSHILGAYERMEPNIMKILRDNPTIEVVIDLHRDGVAEHIHLVDMINGKPTAQIMFFNGLSTLNEGGRLKAVSSLPNANIKSNLAFSFQMQLAANGLFEGFTRKVYLKEYRYSLHMLPKSLLVEVGAQTNTKEEAFNAMEPLADVLAKVLLH